MAAVSILTACLITYDTWTVDNINVAVIVGDLTVLSFQPIFRFRLNIAVH